MTPSAASPRIAVLDIGKTNLKLLVASEDGWPLETHAIPNVANTTGPYLAYDLAGLEQWFLDTLAAVTQRHTIGAVIATAHGCGAVLVDGDEPVLPMMDYDAVSPARCGSANNCSGRKAHIRPNSSARKPILRLRSISALRFGGRAASEIS